MGHKDNVLMRANDGGAELSDLVAIAVEASLATVQASCPLLVDEDLQALEERCHAAAMERIGPENRDRFARRRIDTLDFGTMLKALRGAGGLGAEDTAKAGRTPSGRAA
ncbi:hypothetical protein [Anianabacter salinae]|uniref:hypothetical protein n=1 Tax=Anianabacter salinae TaxID=2851023 RepID=UPI00225DF863|nr:hypothetical protein [Anianabacter salinae]MBV0912325.1 hypothetical protein [Anianabacter salinae]